MSRGFGRGPIWNLTLLRLRELWRQPSTVFWVFGFPLLLALGLGLAFPEPEALTVSAGFSADVPRKALEELEREGIQVHRVEGTEVEAALRSGRVNVMVSAGANQEVDYAFQVDPSSAEGKYAAAEVRRLLERRAGGTDQLVIIEEALKQGPGTRYIDFLIPGLIGMNLMMGSLWGVGWSLVDLRTRRLLQRLRASPVRPTQLLVAIALARLVVIPLEVLLLLAFGYWGFGVTIAGSILGLCLAVLAGSLAFSGLGVLLSGRAENNETITGLINLVTLPMLIGSGIFFSTSHFPEALRSVVAFLPLSALNDALRGIINQGAHLADLKMPFAILGGWAVLTFFAGFRFFRWA